MAEQRTAADIIRSKQAGARMTSKKVKPVLSRPNETHIFVDGMSIIDYFWKANMTKSKYAEDVRHNIYTLWPARIFNAARMLRHKYGGYPNEGTPWCPVVIVYGLPSPQKHSPLQVRRWRTLARQGPSHVGNVTLAFSNTYVNTLATGKFTPELEILYMLEYVTRTSPYSTVLVTENRRLGKAANQRFGTEVRGGRWFEEEVQHAKSHFNDREASRAISALYGRRESISDPLMYLEPGKDNALRKAFLAN